MMKLHRGNFQNTLSMVMICTLLVVNIKIAPRVSFAVVFV